MKNEEIIVLGIDPGYDRVGIAVVKQSLNSKKAGIVYSECFLTKKDEDLNTRILAISARVADIIEKHKPDRLSIEKLYFTNNQKTAMGVAEARGVIINKAKEFGIPVDEYTPPQIKLAITGYGKADKKSIWHMVRALAEIKTDIKYDDEMDAIAIALTSLAINR